MIYPLQIFFILMGNKVASCCNFNLFRELQEEYGQKFVKLMLAQKAKQFISSHFATLNTKFLPIFEEFKAKIGLMTGDRKTELKQVYEKLKLEANSTLPGGLQMIEKLKGKPIDQFTGYNQLQEQIDKVQLTAQQKVEKEKQFVLHSMESRKGEMISEIQEVRPKIQYYEKMSPGIQTILRQQAQSFLETELKENREDLTSSIEKQFNPNNVQTLFAKVNPEGQLSTILNSALKYMSEALGLGSGTGSTLGGLIHNGISIFG